MRKLEIEFLLREAGKLAHEWEFLIIGSQAARLLADSRVFEAARVALQRARRIVLSMVSQPASAKENRAPGQTEIPEG